MCSIKLSTPLLKLRSRKDLVETLLHEMIHAYLFVTQNNRDRDGHGPEFQKHMHRINSEAKTNITVSLVKNYAHSIVCSGGKLMVSSSAFMHLLICLDVNLTHITRL